MIRVGKPFLMTVLMVGSLPGGCDRAQQAPPPQTQEVAVVTVQPRPTVLTRELPGRTAAFLVSDVRPQVSGLVQKRLFTEGSDVKAGDPLFQIDPAQFRAAYDNAKANLDAAVKAVDRARAAVIASAAGVTRQEATLSLAKTDRQRYVELFAKNVVSAIDRDHAVTNCDVSEATLRATEAQVECDQAALAVAEAAVKQAEAALETARINLGYTHVTAPIPGRIGRSCVTDGAIVTAYQAVLATIQTLDPIYVDALAVRGTVTQRIASQESLVHASAETYRLSMERYVKGVDSYLSVFDAQRFLYAAQQELVLLRLENLANQVTLYAVLGGGAVQ